MRRISDGRTEAAILKKITDEFAKFREESTGHSSERLRGLARSAMSAGVMRSQVAAAAGVSPNTISNWVASVRPQAKQLSLISAPRPSPLPVAAAPSRLILIRLKSGIEIEISKQEMSFEFLRLLNELGGAQ